MTNKEVKRIMIKINGMCVGLEVETVHAMHANLTRTMDSLSPFIAASFVTAQAAMTADINLIVVKITQASDKAVLCALQYEWPGVAFILYSEEDKQLVADVLSTCKLHGICSKDDLTSSQLASIVLLALHNKRNEIKSQIAYDMVKHLADMTRFQDATTSFLKELCYLFRWKAGEVWAVNELLAHLTYIVGFSSSSHYALLNQLNAKHSFKKQQGLPGYFYHVNQVIVLNNVTEHVSDHYKDAIAANHFQSCVGIPIRFHRELLGVMIFWSDRAMFLDDEMALMLASIGDQFGEFIKKKRLQGDLLYFSQHDVLTHLANRSVLMDQCEQAIQLADKAHHLVALIYIDIDFFKEFNDQYGHVAGDSLLKNIAECLRTCVRETDTLARLGGDEFAVLLSVADILQVERIANKILYAMAHLNVTAHKNYNVSASIGVSLYPYHGNRFDALLLSADKALSVAKKSGKNTVYIYPYHAVSGVVAKETVIAALKHALFYKEFRLYYQPIVEIESNRIVGAESLLRWPVAPPDMGRPDLFIPIAEEAGLIDQLGAFVLQRACLDAARIVELIKRPFKVVINVSVYQVTREFLSLVTQVLRETALDPTFLTIELTENNLMDSSDYRLEILAAFREIGVKLSIDDFGVGYSSFAYLNKFTVDTIKIDRSFTESMLQLASGKAIVSAILGVAHVLNINVIAEGVQNQEQLDFLRAQQCEFYQGHYFSEALPIEELLLLLTPQPS